jgi:hypothetical protein
VSIVAREYPVNVGKAAQIVSGNAAQLPLSANLHNSLLAPYKLLADLFDAHRLLSL